MGRPAVVPPAGRGRGVDARPCRGAGGEGGALSLKAPEWVRTERTRSLPGGGRPRGPRRRVRAAGSEIGSALPGGRRFGVGYWLVTACCWPGALTCTTAIIFPRGRIIVVEHISSDRPPTRALMRRSYRTPSIPTPIPGVAPRAGMPCPVGAPTWMIDTHRAFVSSVGSPGGIALGGCVWLVKPDN